MQILPNSATGGPHYLSHTCTRHPGPLAAPARPYTKSLYRIRPGFHKGPDRGGHVSPAGAVRSNRWSPNLWQGKLTLENAEGGLFRSAPFVLAALPRTTSRAYQAAQQIVLAIGAQAIQMDASEHDRVLAFTSHLPFLVASALAASAPEEAVKLVGSGFRSTSRLAGTPSSMMLGVLESNRENVLAAIGRLQMN